MPIVNIVPKSKKVEDALAEKMPELRERVKGAICKISGFPYGDVIVSLCFCPYRNVDPAAADLVLYADICPHDQLEVESNVLCSTVAFILAELGFSSGRGAEVWNRYLPGPWCLVINGEIVDSVSHPRQQGGQNV